MSAKSRKHVKKQELSRNYYVANISSSSMEKLSVFRVEKLYIVSAKSRKKEELLRNYYVANISSSSMEKLSMFRV